MSSRMLKEDPEWPGAGLRTFSSIEEPVLFTHILFPSLHNVRLPSVVADVRSSPDDTVSPPVRTRHDQGTGEEVVVIAINRRPTVAFAFFPPARGGRKLRSEGTGRKRPGGGSGSRHRKRRQTSREASGQLARVRGQVGVE